MPPGPARVAYEAFVGRVRGMHEVALVKDGLFGANMSVSLINDGPVTVVLDSPSTTAPAPGRSAAQPPA